MEMPDDIRNLLADVANDFLSDGCEDCGTISIATINRVREALGWQLLETKE